jgi:hypothetical protein
MASASTSSSTEPVKVDKQEAGVEVSRKKQIGDAIPRSQLGRQALAKTIEHQLPFCVGIHRQLALAGRTPGLENQCVLHVIGQHWPAIQIVTAFPIFAEIDDRQLVESTTLRG